jgi:hypothetical protein
MNLGVGTLRPPPPPRCIGGEIPDPPVARQTSDRLGQGGFARRVKTAVEYAGLVGTRRFPQQGSPVHRAEQAPDRHGPDIHALFLQAFRRVPDFAKPAHALDHFRGAVMGFGNRQRQPIALPRLPQPRLRTQGARWRNDAYRFHIRIAVTSVPAGELMRIALPRMVQIAVADEIVVDADDVRRRIRFQQAIK